MQGVRLTSCPILQASNLANQVAGLGGHKWLSLTGHPGFLLQTHNDIVQKILRKGRKGTRVVFIPGNHDESVRQFIGLSFGEIEVLEDAIHTLANGKRLWITHGDLFDGVMQHARWLAYVGDSAYTLILKLNRCFRTRSASAWGYPTGHFLNISSTR